MTEKLHQSDESGYLSALPYLSSFLSAFLFSMISDWLNNKEILSRTACKKLFNSIAHWGSALALCLVAFAGTDATLAVSLLVVTVGLFSAINVGCFSNHLDLAPNFAGTLMGITNGLATISSISAPLYAGLVVTDPTSVSQWQIVFLTSACVFFFGNLVFIIFGTAEVQPWNFPSDEQHPERANTSSKKRDSSAPIDQIS